MSADNNYHLSFPGDQKSNSGETGIAGRKRGGVVLSLAGQFPRTAAG